MTFEWTAEDERNLRMVEEHALPTSARGKTSAKLRAALAELQRREAALYPAAVNNGCCDNPHNMPLVTICSWCGEPQDDATPPTRAPVPVLTDAEILSGQERCGYVNESGQRCVRPETHWGLTAHVTGREEPAPAPVAAEQYEPRCVECLMRPCRCAPAEPAPVAEPTDRGPIKLPVRVIDFDGINIIDATNVVVAGACHSIEHAKTDRRRAERSADDCLVRPRERDEPYVG